MRKREGGQAKGNMKGEWGWVEKQRVGRLREIGRGNGEWG